MIRWSFAFWSALVCAGLTCAAVPLHAAAYSINWLDMSPVPIGNTIASGAVFSLPGYGNVRIDYTGSMNRSHAQQTSYQNGGLCNGGDTYAWTTLDAIEQVNFDAQGTSQTYQVTFTFLSGPMAAGQATLETHGLGRLDLDYPGNITSVTVNQDGTFLGDYDLGPCCAPTDFSGSPGSFTLVNSLPGDTSPGNPAFNTDLGIVRIDDSVSSITLAVNHIGTDGIGFSVGLLNPGPVAVEPNHTRLPQTFELFAPRPNPTQGNCTFAFTIPQAGRVRAEILDVSGRGVARLASDEVLAAGLHSLTWDGRGRSGARVASGIYLVRVSAGPRSATRTLVMVSP